MSRGTLFRSPLLTLGRVAPAGVVAEWTLDLAPVGERQVAEGQRVELHVAVDAGVAQVGAATPVAFDVLPADPGGQPAGEPLLRILGTGATAPAGRRTETRTTVARAPGEGEDA